MKRTRSRFRVGFLGLALEVCACGAAWGQDRISVPQQRLEIVGARAVISVLDDDLIHVSWRSRHEPPESMPGFVTTSMIAKHDYAGPSALSHPDENTLVTPELRIAVDPGTGDIRLLDATHSPARLLSTLRLTAGDDTATLHIDPAGVRNVYGLGEQFPDPPSTDGDWVGRVRMPGNPFGNAMNFFHGGYVGNAQLPIMYALGDAGENYALFLDQVSPITWDFTAETWTVTTTGNALHFFVLAGPDLLNLRRDYMELVGRPPVPPRKFFGLWVSEYGYDDWAELNDTLAGLRAAHCPVDGFVLDLQWFGGISRRVWPAQSRMGSLTWDLLAFPDPAAKIRQLREHDGVGLMLIEESYIDKGLPTFDVMASAGCLVRKCEDCGPVIFDKWWGTGGMIDWTGRDCADFWHDWKRQPLVDMGVLGHWTDLGEPETFIGEAWYQGDGLNGRHQHKYVHNLYNFYWLESIARGYARHSEIDRRPFMMSRSGTSGVQRFGAAMWSGDIGSNMPSLAAQMNVQMHMSFSGIDYFGADIGGFHRWSLDGDIDELYTRWLAEGLAFDVPARPHTSNHRNEHETSPALIGDLASNLANVRRRYELIPYVYSLAHRAYRYGDPVIAPLVMHYPQDENVREMGSEKLIGGDLLVAASTQYDRTRCRVYLPAGTWFDYHTDEPVPATDGSLTSSAGRWVGSVPLYRNGLFTLPMFARGGAIIPQMFVDELTMNAAGRRLDGSTRDELRLLVFAFPEPTSFTLYEDDGRTVAYRRGKVRTTVISQQLSSNGCKVEIASADGDYDGAPDARGLFVKLVFPKALNVAEVLLDGAPMPEIVSPDEFGKAAEGWRQAGPNVVFAKAGRQPVRNARRLGVNFNPG